MSKIEEVLSNQIAEAQTLLQRAISIPDGDTNTLVAGYIRYDEKITRPLAKDVEAWQTETIEFLRVLYGENSRQVTDFERCVKDKSHYFKFREGIQSELHDCISKLKAYIKADAMKQEIIGISEEDTSGKPGTPLVFISHASLDKNIIKSFVDRVLKEGLGLRDENIAFTSYESTGVTPGDDIPKYIADNIGASQVFLAMISPSYKASEVCQNEVGAAWALGKNPVLVLLSDVDFTQLGWLFNLNKAGRIDDQDYLDHLEEVLCARLRLDLVSPRHWNPCVKAFLESIKSDYLPVVKDKEKSELIIHNPIAKAKSIGALQLFDGEFKCICLKEGEYIIQINLRLRAESNSVSIKHVYLRNKIPFTGSLSKSKKELEFKLFIHQGVFELSDDGEKAKGFLKNEFNKECNPVLDMTVEKEHTVSVSFLQYLMTIRESDGYDELQMKGWEIVVQYNVDEEVLIPLRLQPVDNNPRGKYLDN